MNRNSHFVLRNSFSETIETLTMIFHGNITVQFPNSHAAPVSCQSSP